MEYGGWDRFNLKFSFYEELITLDKFEDRLMKPTMMVPVVKDKKTK
jgi:hypothetical protein